MDEKSVPNPGHRPGFLPNFLADNGAEVIIAGGMGGGAVDIFNERNVEVIVGAQGDAKELYGMRIPFTQSKYIYSYDIVIKAGYDFNEIEWKEKNKTIEVKLPEAKVLSNELDMDSFKVYHEEESIFSKITLEENNDAVKKMKLNAQENAIANGLLENARSNAETMLTGFFADEYDLDEYKIVFKDK